MSRETNIIKHFLRWDSGKALHDQVLRTLASDAPEACDLALDPLLRLTRKTAELEGGFGDRFDFFTGGGPSLEFKQAVDRLEDHRGMAWHAWKQACMRRRPGE